MGNRLWNNIFINPPPLPLLCEISGALHLVQPGITAGWLAASAYYITLNLAACDIIMNDNIKPCNLHRSLIVAWTITQGRAVIYAVEFSSHA